MSFRAAGWGYMVLAVVVHVFVAGRLNVHYVGETQFGANIYLLMTLTVFIFGAPFLWAVAALVKTGSFLRTVLALLTWAPMQFSLTASFQVNNSMGNDVNLNAWAVRLLQGDRDDMFRAWDSPVHFVMLLPLIGLVFVQLRLAGWTVRRAA